MSVAAVDLEKSSGSAGGFSHADRTKVGCTFVRLCMNQLRIRGKAVAKSALRYTPAGVAVLEASFMHEGAVTEAASERILVFEFSALALGAVAQALEREPLGVPMLLEGFIAPRTRRSTRLVVHINEYEVIGNEISCRRECAGSPE